MAKLASRDFKIDTKTPEVLKFLRQLLLVDVFNYCYQEETFRWPFVAESRREEMLREIDRRKKKPKLEGKNWGGVRHYSYSEIVTLTGSFSNEQLIKKIPLGRLFRAKVVSDSGEERDVAIKTWDVIYPWNHNYFNFPKKLVNELLMFTDGKMRPNPDTVLHPVEDVLRSNSNLAKVIGYSCDKIFAVVYDLQSSDQSVHDVIPTDTFDWESRMRLAMEMAKLVQLVHDRQYSVGSIDSENIMIDKDGNFKLFVLGLHPLVGSDDVPPPRHRYDFYFLESYATAAPEYASGDGEFNVIKVDIYGFGILLLELITKQVYEESFYSMRKKGSLVDASFNIEDDVVSKITDLVHSCLEDDPDKRPEMSQIVGILENIYDDLVLHPRKKLKMDDDHNDGCDGVI